MSQAILYDATRCTGCERCVAACVEANGLDRAMADRDAATTSDGLSGSRLCTILQVEESHFIRKSCMHCQEPSCVAACLVGGLSKTDAGPVVYDADKCIGCRYCMLACPFHVPRYEWDRTAPVMKKCDMCYDRITSGNVPACVEGCPGQALSFGPREQLLKTARETVAAKPETYIQRVWGESEYGGTSILAISDIDLAPAGWPVHGSVPIPSLTDPLIHKTPYIGFGVALGTWALSAIIHRRQLLMGKEEPEESR